MALLKKVDQELINYSVSQMRLGVLASLFCSSIILVGLYDTSPSVYLFGWYAFSAVLAFSRLTLSEIYKRRKSPSEHSTFWYFLLSSGVVLSGMTWGFVGAVLFPTASSLEQTLCILVIAGVTAGGVPVLSALLPAAILFYTFAILPIIVHIFFIHSFMYTLFDSTLMIYLIFLTGVTFKIHNILRNMFYLKFENDLLLKDLVNANKKLEQQATHDPLTHVANRSLFDIDFNNAIKRAKRNNTLLGLLYIDIDNFKKVNDNYGHILGDQLLLAVVERLQNTLRTTDTISRLGGDEFVVILEELTNEKEISTAAKRICESFSAPFFLQHYSISVTVSIGGSLYPLDGLDLDTLITVADTAMYRSKSLGRNTFYFEPHPRA